MAAEEARRTGERLAAISNMVVGIYADCLGRGPTKARSYIEDDVVLCLLENTLTKAERRLRDAGDEERLLAFRANVRKTMHGELVAGMEQIVGRRVRALIGGTQLEPDVASEVFILGAPLPEVGSDRRDDGAMPADRY